MFAWLLNEPIIPCVSTNDNKSDRGVDVIGRNSNTNFLTEREAWWDKFLSTIAEKVAADAHVVEIQTALSLAETNKAELELKLNKFLLTAQEVESSRAVADTAAATVFAFPISVSKKYPITPQQRLIEDIVKEFYIALDTVSGSNWNQFQRPCTKFQKLIYLNRLECYAQSRDFGVIQLLSTSSLPYDEADSKYEYYFNKYVEYINTLKNSSKMSLVQVEETRHLASVYKCLFRGHCSPAERASLNMTDTELAKFKCLPKPVSALQIFEYPILSYRNNGNTRYTPVDDCKKFITICNVDLANSMVQENHTLWNIVNRLLQAATSCLADYCHVFYRDDTEIVPNKVQQLFATQLTPLCLLSELVKYYKLKYEADLGSDEMLQYACKDTILALENMLKEALEWTKEIMPLLPNYNTAYCCHSRYRLHNGYLVIDIFKWNERYKHLVALIPVLTSISKVGAKRWIFRQECNTFNACDLNDTHEYTASTTMLHDMWTALRTAEEEARVEIDKIWGMENEM